MMPGRFFLGVGTGEYLSEHILGKHWPTAAIRREMLAEAVEIVRHLWTGKWVSHYGSYYTGENARVYTLPDEPPRVLVAAAGPRSADLAGRIGDGLISVAPKAELVKRFETAGGAGRPRYGKLTVCWAPTEAETQRIAHAWWPNAAIPGDLGSRLPLPSNFDHVTQLVTEEEVAKAIVIGPDAEQQISAIQRFVDAGFDHVYVHQLGPDQEGFFQFYEREVLPHVQ
jgi:coenzyme F420-dependent glucose-6-phosphate dehydrogenase